MSPSAKLLLSKHPELCKEISAEFAVFQVAESKELKVKPKTKRKFSFGEAWYTIPTWEDFVKHTFKRKRKTK